MKKPTDAELRGLADTKAVNPRYGRLTVGEAVREAFLSPKRKKTGTSHEGDPGLTTKSAPRSKGHSER